MSIHTRASRIFYSATLDHRERAAKFRALLDELERQAATHPTAEPPVEVEQEIAEVSRYLGDVQRMIESGATAWDDDREEPALARKRHDDAMRQAIEWAAPRVQPVTGKDSFQELALERALIDGIQATSPGAEAKARTQLPVADWDPQPGAVDLVASLLGEDEPSVVAELKIYDVDQALWELLKVTAALKARPQLRAGYLVFASTPSRWRKSDCAELFDAAHGTKIWDVRDMFVRWRGAWAHAIKASARPLSAPAAVETRFIAAAPAAAYAQDEYEIRCIGVCDAAHVEPIQFDGDWPRSE